MTATTTTPIDRVLTAFKAAGCDPKPNGKSWSVRCPLHEDHRPSMSVSAGEDGTVLLHCHRCGKPATKDILNKVGLRLRDLFAPITPTNGPARRNGDRRIVETYGYRDAAGALLYEVVRFIPKDFAQRRPDGNGGWVWNLKDTPRVLYRLPMLLAAPDAIVYITEGEKDADRLRADGGMLSTTCPGGAGKWPKLSDDSALTGRHVVILPDADTAGRDHGQEVARRLHGRAASVRLLDLWRDRHDGSDVSDWLDSGHDTDALDGLAATAPLWTPPAGGAEAPKAGPTGPEQPASRACTRRLIDVAPERQRWLWPHRLPLGSLSLIAGMQGLGKSFTSLDLGCRVSTGRAWPDSPRPIEQGNVILLGLEDDPHTTIRPRVDAMGGDPARITLLEGVAEVDHSGVRTFSIERDVHLLDATIRTVGDVRLVIVDPLTAFMGGDRDMFKDNEVRAVLNPLVQLAREHDLAIIGIMHLRKAASDRAIFRVIGSVAFSALARATWLVGEDRENPKEDRVFLPAKLNVAKAAPGLRFRIADPGVVEWLGSTDQTAEECFATPDQKADDGAGPKTQAAKDFLRSALAGGPQRSKDIKKQAQDNAISDRTLERAAAELGIKADNGKVFGNPWYWELPS